MNALRIDDKPGEDTRRSVRSVLMFMVDAFEAFEKKDDFLLTGTMAGAARIIGLCADALKEADKPERGADVQ